MTQKTYQINKIGKLNERTNMDTLNPIVVLLNKKEREALGYELELQQNPFFGSQHVSTQFVKVIKQVGEVQVICYALINRQFIGVDGITLSKYIADKLEVNLGDNIVIDTTLTESEVEEAKRFQKEAFIEVRNR